jgi:hypothetical protein
VTIKPRSAILLDAAGDYFFDSLTLDADSVLTLPTTGRARLFVKSSFTFRGSVTEEGGGASRLFVAYFGTSDALIQAGFDGTVVAPRAKVVLASALHVGSFFGKKLEVQAGASLRFTPFGGAWLPGTTL